MQPLFLDPRTLIVSPQKAAADMEEEKTFFMSRFIALSLAPTVRIMQRKISKKKKRSIKPVAAKINIELGLNLFRE